MILRLMSVAGLCLWASPGQGATTWHLGLNLQAGYNSNLLGFTANPTGGDQGQVQGLILSATPWAEIQVETGRITQRLRVQHLSEGLISSQSGYSYTNTLISQTKIDLTGRLSWAVNLSGAQGKLQSLLRSDDPVNRQITAIRLGAQEFLSLNVNSLLVGEPSARVRISQPATFQAFIPYGELPTAEGMPTGQVTGTLQRTLLVDGGLGVDYEWARVALGATVRVGWFHPQGTNDFLTGSAIARLRADFSQRWQGTAYGGVFFANNTDHLFQYSELVPSDPNNPSSPLEQRYYMQIRPIGGAMLGYLFPRIDWTLSLAYDTAGTGEVFIGRLTWSHGPTLRAFMPLRIPKIRGVVLSASAGYRFAELLFTSTVQTAPMMEAATSSYHIVQADASLTVPLRDYLFLSARYQYLYQTFPTDQSQTGYHGHLAVLGMGLVYPPR